MSNASKWTAGAEGVGREPSSADEVLLLQEQLEVEQEVARNLMTVIKQLREPKYCDSENVCSECANHNLKHGYTALGLKK